MAAPSSARCVAGRCAFASTAGGTSGRARSSAWPIPSHADAERNDPTIWSLLRLARTLPVGGFTVVNLEPFIASAPGICVNGDATRWARDREIMARIQGKNSRLIRELSESAAIRIVAWGQLLSGRPPAPRLLRALSLDFTQALHAFALTQDGCPKHPLARGRHRIEACRELVLWRGAARESK